MSPVLITAALKGTAVLLSAALAAIILRRRSAAARHLLWTGAAAAIIALPLLSLALPALHVHAPGFLAPLDPSAVFHITAASGPATADATPAAPSATRSTSPAAPARRTPNFSTILLLVWTAGAAAGLLQMAFAWMSLARLRRRARPFPGLDEAVPVLEIPAGRMPMAFGIVKPAVFLPADAALWAPDRLRMVLLHELAHVRRGDLATHLLARTALCLYWWNPLAWFAWREFLKERERAADDLVLASGARASDYAGHLLEVARTFTPAPAGVAAVAMARRSQLEGRLLAILDARANRRAAGPVAALAAAFAAFFIVAPFAAVQAQTEQQISPEVDATIRAALAQKNHDILDVAAKAFIDLRQYDNAQKLLETSLAIRQEVEGAKSAAYAAGLLKLGDLAVKRHNEADAQDFYARALALGDTPEAASALVYLGTRALVAKDPGTARDFFQRALKADPVGAQARPALMWLARIAQIDRDIAQAETYYQQAESVGDQESTEAVLVLKQHARFLRELGRDSEADDLTQRADGLRSAYMAKIRAQSRVNLRATGGPALPGVGIFESQGAKPSPAQTAASGAKV
ncbi:MAG TPA: M56 family metallopeptidase, partial [Bryobacteraceae bacterium]